jgi:hypothetical protein
MYITLNVCLLRKCKKIKKLNKQNLKLRLFLCKIFSAKCFPSFLVFGAIENNSHTETILCLTKKASLVSENDFHF